MDAKMMYAIENGIETFLQSGDCSAHVREQVLREQKEEERRGMHFHDLALVLTTTLSAFVAGLAANVAAAYFERKYLSADEAKKVAKDAARIKSNEIRLKLGPKAIEQCPLSETEVESLGKHVRNACEKMRE